MKGIVLGALFIVGCGQLDVFDMERVLPPSPDAGTPVTPAIVPTDILFVIDNSGSMGEEQLGLIAGFDGFISALRGGDYRIAVISTDMTNPTHRAGFSNSTWAGEWPYQLMDFGQDCQEAGAAAGCFQGPNPASRVVDPERMSEQEQIDAFSMNARLGTCGSGDERAFDALLGAYELRGSCNQNFFRREAHLVVIFVSDENESGTEPVESYMQQLLRIKEDPAKIRIGAIVGLRGDSCAPDYGTSCGSICETPPAQGSGRACVSGQCPSGEYCENSVCTNQALQFWDNCASCAFYRAPDCCTAFSAARYFDFALEWERTVAARTGIVARGCSSQGAGICLVSSICQGTFESTLRLMALTLIPREKL